MTLGAVRYSVRAAPVPRACPCRCCSEEAVAACLGRAKPDRRTLERLQRRLGRGAERTSRQQRLQALTERLLPRPHTAAVAATPPPPPPPPPHTAPVLPPVPPPRTRHRHSPPRGFSVGRTTTDDFNADNFTLGRVESRSIVGSYAQKTIPYRSASFSQGDFLPEKYYCGTLKPPSIFDFGKRPVKLIEEERPCASKRRHEVESGSFGTEETATEGGSVASVDSAVGSDEGLLAHTSPAPRSPPPEGPHKQLGARSLTHPLPQIRRTPVRDPSPGESGSLPTLMPPRILHELREESDGSQADSAQAQSESTSPFETSQPFTFPPLPDPPANACANIDCDCVNFPIDQESVSSIPVPVYECIVKQWSKDLSQDDSLQFDTISDGSTDRDKEDETITKEQVASLLAAVQNTKVAASAAIAARERRKPQDVKIRRRKGIYITTTSDDGGEDDPTPSVNGSKRDSSEISLQGSRHSTEARTSSLLGDKSDDSCANEPPSPCEAPISLWPRSEELRMRRARLSHQSSDERDEDTYRFRRKFGVTSRGDSPSEAESDTCSRDRTASPSPFSPSEFTDIDGRRFQLSRGPFGRTLEAPVTKSVEVGRRSFSDATVPGRKAGSVCVGSVRGRGPTHVRATSSPSKLAGVRPGADLLAELLRGSSEALSNTSSFDNVVLTLHQHNVSRFSYNIS